MEHFFLCISSSGYKHNVSKTLNYDDNSNLIDIVQNFTRVGFQYDKINRPIEAQTFNDYTGHVKQPASILKYTYTPGEQVKSIKNSNGLELVGYEFDSNFYPNIIRSGKYSIAIENDSLGRKKKISYPNKLETTFAFDDVNRLEEIETKGVGFRNYKYDELSNINQVKFESGQLDYTYDQSSALIGAYYKGGEGIPDEKFAWDGSGNRLNGTRDSAENSIRPRPIVINNGLFEDAEPINGNGIGRFSFIYDMHGNVIKKFDNQENIYYVFEYDAENKLVYVEKVKNDSLELKAKFTYDGLGRRIEKEVINGSTVNRKSYVYNGDNIFQEFNTTGLSSQETAKYIGSGIIDDNLMTIRNGKGFFYHKDHLGSINAITNDSGEIVQSNQYSSFGKIISIKDKERRELGFEKALDQPFYFTGREWDSEIGLYSYRARSYDPNIGRFLSSDPIGLAGMDTNLYRYVGNNPVNFIDPNGHFGVVGAAIGFVSGGIGGAITSGNLTGVVVGALAGAAVGLITPGASSTAGATAAAFVSGFGGSVLGQAAGNLVIGKKPLSNISYTSAVGSGIGAGAAATLGSGLLVSGFFSKTLGVLAQGTVEGVFSGVGELAGLVLSNNLNDQPTNTSISGGSACYAH